MNLKYHHSNQQNSLNRENDNTRINLYLFGTMLAIEPNGEDFLPTPRKVRAMLAYLCLIEETHIPRIRFMNLLWGDSPSEQAAKSLRHALWQLSRTINRFAPDLIEITRDWIRLDKNRCWIDTKHSFEQGDRLLEGFDGITNPFDRWLSAERARFEDRARTILERRLQQLIDEGAPPELRAAAARRLTNFEPTHEGGVRALMAALYDMGDPAQAIREFERCREAVRADNLPLSNQTVALQESIRLVSIARRPAQQNSSSHRYNPTPPVAARAHALSEHNSSVAVLPFLSWAESGHYDYAAAGVENNLVEGLSRIPDLFVISRMSTMAFRGTARNPRELGEVLGVRYIVSGKLGVMGDRIGLRAQLDDTGEETTLWSCSVDERNFSWAEVNERLADSVARRVAPWKQNYAGERTQVNHSEAYDLFLRAQENMHNSSRVVFDTCEHLFDAAFAVDPTYAAALAWRARWHLLRVAQGWSADPKQDAKSADRFAKRAIQCDPMEPMAHGVHGHIAAYLHKDFGAALRRFETALRVNPNSAPAWFWSATVHAWLGDGPCAVEHIRRALALSPYDPLIHAYNTTAGLSYIVNGEYERAVEYSLRAVGENRSHISAYHMLAVSLVLAGYDSEAQSAVRELLRRDPTLTVNHFRRRSPICSGPHAQLFCDALGVAGVPLAR